MSNKKPHYLRNFLAVLLSFALIISCLETVVTVNAEDNNKAADEAASSVYADGTYEGTGRGRNGDIRVAVTVENDTITAIEVLDQNETPEYWAELLSEDGSNVITESIINAQSTEVDDVTGATLSSEGIKDAVNDALSKAACSIPGSGTARDPYVIYDGSHLEYFADRIDEGDEAYTGSYVVLGSDIDLSSIPKWNPIGAEGRASANKTRLFAGAFDGRGFVISGLTISGEYESEVNAGLFSTLAASAQIRNTVIENIDINIISTGDMSPARAGGIAGDTQSAQSSDGTLIDGCSVSGTVSVKANTSSSYCGGLLGRSMSGTSIVNCVSYADAEASSEGVGNAAYAGCIIGASGNNNILANCASHAAVSASNTAGGADAYAGGIAGMLSSTTYNVYASGTTSIAQNESVEEFNAGVIAGQAAGSSSGDYLYFANDAAVIVNGEASTARALGNSLGIKTDSCIGMPSGDMGSDSFANTLNSNIRSVIDAIDLQSAELREWITEDGKVVLSENIWVPGEVDEEIFESGTGTQDDPYIISTKEQLIAFAGSLNSKIDYRDKHIRLENDIDISGENWIPVGGSYARFDGEFDGNGKSVNGLREGTETEPAELDASNSYIGLFGWLSEHASIHDLTLADVMINTHSTGSAYIGGIAGRMSGSDTEGDYHGAAIDNCTVTGTITHTTDKGTSFIGGAAGHMFKGTVINTMTDVTMNARELSGELVEAGGIAGLLNRGLIANSYALGGITGSGYRDTRYDIEGMACVGNIAAVNGGYIANCYGQGDVEAKEYSIDTGIIAGWVTGIAKAYNCWYNEDAVMMIDGRRVDPVDPFGETVAGGVSDEWGFKFPGALIDNNNGYHPDTDADKVAAGLNASFDSFPIDIKGIYGLSDDALKMWTVRDGQVILDNTRAGVTYVQPEIEKNIEDVPETELLDGIWYGRSSDKSTVVSIKVADGKTEKAAVIKGSTSGEAYDEALARAEYKARFGDTSSYEPANLSGFKGKGTRTDPFRIETEKQLRYLADSINEDVDWKGVYFKQTADIAITGEEWKPIGWGIFADADGDGFGQDVVALYPFRGIYDGGNHVIRGLRAGSKIKPSAMNYMGLFGIIQGDYTDNTIPENGYRAELKNIKIEDAELYTENCWRSYIGGLVANAQGGFSIDNCTVTGTIDSRSTVDFAFAGGLAGSLMYGSVTNCRTDVNSTAWSGKSYSYAGGMSGTTNRATIVNSCTTGSTHADADQTNRAEAGGFVALDGGTCINCYAKGDVEIVSKYSMYIGGFTGMAASSSEHRQCYFNTDASQKVAGTEASEKRYAGKFVNESAEANSQAQSAKIMRSEEFANILESNRNNIAATLSEVRRTLGADSKGSSSYHSVYYNGDGTDLSPWILTDGSVVPASNERAADKEESASPSGNSAADNKSGAGTGTASTSKETAKSADKAVRKVTVNTRTVTAKSVDKAVRKAGGSADSVTTIVLGKKVRRIKKGAFRKYKKAAKLVIRSRKLKKSKVRKSLKGSSVKVVKVQVGKKSANKKFARKYRKIFTRKNAGRRVKVKA